MPPHLTQDFKNLKVFLGDNVKYYCYYCSVIVNSLNLISVRVLFLFQKSKFSFVHLVLFYSISFLIQEDQSSL